MPRPGTPVLHPRMLKGLRSAAVAAHTARCQLLGAKPPRGPLDPATGKHQQAVRPVLWSGPCRVQRQSRTDPQDVDAGGQQLVITGYQVTVAMDVPIAGVQQVVVTAAPHDPALVGAELDVADIVLGEQQAERLILCERG